MGDFIYTLIGIAGTIVVLFLAKWFGGKKGTEVPASDSKRTVEALETASELLGKRAAAEAKGEEDRARVEEKLKIEDPVERLEAIANELKDL
jgi:hypothetical protein